MRGVVSSLWVALVAACAAPGPEGPGRPQLTDDPELEAPEAVVTEQHRWLTQLVGDWEVAMEARMAPDEPPTRWTIRETARAVGDLWVVIEGHTIDGEPAYESRMTLGFDPEQGAFVGSWIDSLQTRLWTYRGELSDDGTRLVLATQGPPQDGTGPGTRFRDTLEILGPDTKRMTSTAQSEDGSWPVYMIADGQRRP